MKGSVVISEDKYYETLDKCKQLVKCKRSTRFPPDTFSVSFRVIKKLNAQSAPGTFVLDI